VIVARVDIKGTVDGIEVMGAFADGEKQVPYVGAIMLTKLATDVRSRIQRRLPEVFDRPTDFTVRGVFTRPASRDNLVAEVYFPDSDAEQGRAAREFIRPGALGTYQRAQKKTEWLLTRLGVLPAGWVTTPGKGAKLDGYGNLSGRIYAQIINVLQLKAQVVGGRSVAARSQKRAERLGVSAEFFAVPPGANRLARNGGWLPPGVWKHLLGHRITQILKFVRKAGYRKRLNMEDEAKQVLGAQTERRWQEASSIIRDRFRKAR
jgi:hypothetical protein